MSVTHEASFPFFRHSQVHPAQKCDKKYSKKISEQWKYFEWDHLSKLQTDHPDFCEFIHRTKLVYAIRGYQSSLQNSEILGVENLQEAIHIDTDGHPSILKQGEWTRWEDLRNTIVCHPKTKELVSKENNKEEWNYYYNPETGEQGLNPNSRYKQIRPIYRLNQSEMQRLGMNNENCILQIFTTTAASFLPQLSHVGLRLINQRGLVYSLGYETPSWELPYRQQKIVGNYHAEITSLDSDEFSEFKQRRVTSFLVTPAQFDLALTRIEMYTKKPIRFNRIHQNCATYVTDIMRAAQLYSPPITCTLRDFLWDFIIDIPFVGNILDNIMKVVAAVFELLSVLPLISYIFDGINFATNKILTLISNLLILSCGASKGSETFPDVEEDTINNTERLTYFSYLIKTWKDIFKIDRDLVFFPKKLIEWQIKQENTFIHDYAGPKLYITPLQQDVQQ